ncbi:metallophosphoesterase [Brevibacillus sp. TJ4]|uniref:metallophosphoesterase n=1 Tax=Brevibacillus sp. TJ4 TaxID=3234853 RepID=UPI0037D786DF
MAILVLSDSHGLVREVESVVARHPDVEKILHCGDFCVSHQRKPFAGMVLVRGNCDTTKAVPNERQSSWKDLRILQTHGHLYGVKSSLLRLHYRAEETGVNVVLFGHSHTPVCAEERGILFLNPGSLQMPRGFDKPTYAIVEQTDATPEAVFVQVAYYDRAGNPEPRLGGQFSLRR